MTGKWTTWDHQAANCFVPESRSVDAGYGSRRVRLGGTASVRWVILMESCSCLRLLPAEWMVSSARIISIRSIGTAAKVSLMPTVALRETATSSQVCSISPILRLFRDPYRSEGRHYSLDSTALLYACPRHGMISCPSSAPSVPASCPCFPLRHIHYSSAAAVVVVACLVRGFVSRIV